MNIYRLSRIHNTRLTSAYFGLDNNECECLEYLFIIHLNCSMAFLDLSVQKDRKVLNGVRILSSRCPCDSVERNQFLLTFDLYGRL
jgi:hypothetical protein